MAANAERPPYVTRPLAPPRAFLKLVSNTGKEHLLPLSRSEVRAACAIFTAGAEASAHAASIFMADCPRFSEKGAHLLVSRTARELAMFMRFGVARGAPIITRWRREHGAHVEDTIELVPALPQDER
jgi:hypothetical protein